MRKKPTSTKKPTQSVVIVGAGPAGLTAAYLLSKKGVKTTVLESHPKYVGGIAKTVRYKGFHFDIGGHRFFSKSEQVENLWTELLPKDMLTRPRSSRIFYRNKFFAYPLKPFEALLKLGLFESTLCILSYFSARLFPKPNPKNFEDWVSNQFGRRLFRIFFKTYTEKVWGMNCKAISADWAAQRIKGLSLWKAFTNAFIKPKTTDGRGKVIKSLIESFRYPRRGPGMLWEACTKKIETLGGEVLLDRKVDTITYDKKKHTWTVSCVDSKGKRTKHQAHHVISTMAIRELAQSLSPSLSPKATRAAQALKYRDFLTVVVILKEKHLFDDNWLYIHDPSVLVGRIQNFKSWSEEMVPDPSYCCYGLEYFCFENEELWNAADATLIQLAKKELEKIGLAKAEEILDGCVVRQPKAYPVYDDHYRAHVETIRKEIETNFPGLHLIGRNGMHKYNNQDHAMMTAMLTVENILQGKTVYDVWQVNEDAEYHEESHGKESHSVSGLRQVPQAIPGQDKRVQKTAA